MISFTCQNQYFTRHLLSGGAFLCLFESTCIAQHSNVEEDIRDIMLSGPPTNFIPIISIGVLVLLLLFGVFYFISRLMNAPMLAEKGPPADYVALEKLNKISKNIESISPNRASLEVSDTIKDFLSRKFRDPIRFETAEEFFLRISSDANLNLSSSLVDQVRAFLNTSQELKFAKLKEGKNQIPKLIDQAEQIIRTAKKQS